MNEDTLRGVTEFFKRTSFLTIAYVGLEEHVSQAEKGCFGTDKSTVFSVLINNA